MNIQSVNALINKYHDLQSQQKFSHQDYLDGYIKEGLTNIKDKHPDIYRILKKYIVPDKEKLRYIFRHDLFCLLVVGCRRYDMVNWWCYYRSQEVQKCPNMCLDLWARDHYKSTIITFGKSMQDIFLSHGDDVKVSPVTIGIFSCTRPLAKAFLRQIKLEFERNDFLKYIFDDVLYQNPKGEAFKWSEDEGIIVKRSTNPKESTVEAWGLIESQPTSKHFSICVYDDIITRDIVKTPYMIQLSTEAWEDSLNLASSPPIQRYVGTRKHFNDVYSVIMKRTKVKLRLYTAYDKHGKPHLKGIEELEDKRRAMGEIMWACEMSQNPILDSARAFNTTHLRYHAIETLSNVNVYLICDPANSKKKTSDYTVMLVIAIDNNSNVIVIDGLRDRLNLFERFDGLVHFLNKYPEILLIGYEQVGMVSDIDAFKMKMNSTGFYFDDLIYEMTPPPKLSKEDRINKIDITKLLMPRVLKRVRINGQPYDLIEDFINEELIHYPVSVHDDILDTIAWAYMLLAKGEISCKMGKNDSLDLKSYYEQSREF